MKALLLTATLLGALMAPASAATITVNTSADTVLADSLCSLREAIGNANADTLSFQDCTSGAGSDTIFFNGVTSITLSSILSILSNITIEGPIVLQGFGSDVNAAFDVGTNGSLTLNRVTSSPTTGGSTGTSPGGTPGTAAVSEPSALALAGLALLGMALSRRRDRRPAVTA